VKLSDRVRVLLPFSKRKVAVREEITKILPYSWLKHSVLEKLYIVCSGWGMASHLGGDSAVNLSFNGCYAARGAPKCLGRQCV
jgi:hypothetical protein